MPFCRSSPITNSRATSEKSSNCRDWSWKYLLRLSQRQTNDIKKMLYKLSRDFTDQSSKQKTKEMWNTAGKEIEKNKKIMEEFINKAAASEAFLKRIEQSGGKRFSKTELEGSSNKTKDVVPKEKEGVSMM